MTDRFDCFCLQVIPILQTLYNAPHSTSYHIYMSLIILLILSEDESFNKNVHQIVSEGVVLRLFVSKAYADSL